MEGSASQEAARFVGRTFGEFVVREVISSGGFGLVFHAEQPQLARQAVVKVLHARLLASETAVQRFLREALLASRLDHPYAAHTYAFGAEPDGVLWIAMELVRGTPLDRLLAVHGPLPLRRLVPLLERICEVVHTAHEQGIVHRDLKPANVMVLARAGRLLPKLLDFGIAKAADALPEGSARLPAMRRTPPSMTAATLTVAVDGSLDVTMPIEGDLPGAATMVDAGDPRAAVTRGAATGDAVSTAASWLIDDDAVGRLTRDGSTIGSPLYMAPEQWIDAGAADERTDIYALGVLAYEALVGAPPFQGRSQVELARAHASSPPPSLGPSFPAELDLVLARALAKQPAARFASALEFAAAFRAASGVEEQATPVPQLDAELRARVLAAAPQPLAMAVARLEAASNLYKAQGAIWQVARVAMRLVGLIALASHGHVDLGTTDPSLVEALRRLRSHGVDDHGWLEIARALARPFAAVRDAHPVPELLDFLDDGALALDALATWHVEVARGTADDAETLAQVERALPLLARALGALDFLDAYALVTRTARGAELWMGLPRRDRASIAGAARLELGRPTLVDETGAPVVQLWPFVQCRSPSPGAPEALFLFDGGGRRGARLVALPEAFELEDEALWEVFGGLLGDTEPSLGAASIEQHSPFPGLSAFGVADAASFFGRERETAAFVNRLREQPLLAVVGPSGAGKSSFVQAGVLPALPAGWRAITLRPGPSPLGALAARLAVLGIGSRDATDQLAIAADALGVALRQHAAARGETLVLVVDQLEELFTLCADDGERRWFATALAGAARSADDPVRVVVTLRDDFLLRAEALPGFTARLSQGLQLLTTPERTDLVRIITEPLRRIGYELDDAALADEMVAEVEGQPGALALLSFTASKLWELRDRRFRQLGRKAYASLGGVGGALAQHAEATLAALPADEQRLVREVFRHLVTAEGTRAVLSRAELDQVLGGGRHAAAVLEKLVAARLVVSAEDDAGGERVEVTHEALLAAWPRLVGWRREDAEGARLRDQLRAAARQWDDRGRPGGLLWRDDALAEYRLWRSRHGSALTASEAAFAAASEADADRGRRLKTALIAGGFLILVAGVVGLLVFNTRIAGERADAQRARGEALRSNEELHDRLLSLYESQARRLVLADDPLQALAYLGEAGKLGAHGSAHDLLVAEGLQATSGELHRFSHESLVLRTRFSPDGARLLTASYDKSARLWDVASGRQLARLDHGGPVFRAEFSPDGARIATASQDGTVGLWDAVTGARLTTLRPGKNGVAAALFSPDGGHLVTVGLDDEVVLWRAGGDRRMTLRPAGTPAQLAKALAFSPDGARVAVGDETGVVRLWDLPSGRLRATLAGHAARVTWVQFDRAGRQLVSASEDHTAIVWDPATGGRGAVLRHREPILAAGFSPDGARIATASGDRTAVVWDARTGAPLLTLGGHAAGVNRATYSPDGRLIATTSYDATAALWDARTGRRVARLLGHGGAVFDAVFSPDGTMLATGSQDNAAALWRAAPQAVSISFDAGLAIRWAGFSPDGKSFATAGADGHAALWDAATARVRTRLVGHRGRVHQTRFSSDGRQVVTSGDDGTIRLFDAASGAPRAVLTGHTGMIEYVAFSPDETRLASAGADGTLRIWDVATATQLRSIVAHGGSEVFAVGYRDDRRVVSEGDDGITRVWDGETGAELTRFVMPDLPFTIAFDRGRKRIASSDVSQRAAIWDADTGRTLVRLAGHSGNLLTAEWSPDDRLLATSSTDGTARLWDPERGDPLMVLELGNAEVWAASFSPDGRRLLTASMDGTGGVWELPRFTGNAAELDRLIRCRVPYQVEGDRLVPRARDLAACRTTSP